MFAFCLTTTLLLPSCTAPASFEEARQRGQVGGMQRHFERMVEEGVIQRGMVREQIEAVLGPADTATGIYTPGGYSIGYGSAPPAAFNYDEFFWLHLRARDWSPGGQDGGGAEAGADEPEVLIGWGN